MVGFEGQAEIGKLNLAGVTLDEADMDFIAYWRQRLPHDFNEKDERARIYLGFELNGINRGQAALKRLEGYFTVRDKIVLDVGSGNGGQCIAAALAGAKKVYGLELDPVRIDLAKKWAECRGVEIFVERGVAEKLPYEDASIDIVFSFSVIEHVTSHDKMLAEIGRVLRPGGYAVIEGPNRLSPKLFLADPHYQIMAVSALPRPIAKWWVLKVKKIAYDYGVGVFPIYSLLIRKLRRYGFDLITSEHHDYRIERLEHPDAIRSRMRYLVKLLAWMRLNKALATVLRNTSPIFEILVQKSSSPLLK